ncbi:MAG TPA: 2-oxo acid dehydrogenase subunit E2, partial [Anaeromyxobacter sp.]
MRTIEVKIPSIGDYKDVPIIDVLVKPGDEVSANDSLVTLESDKATMDVPAPAAGKVRDVRVRVGDRVSEGSLVVTLEADGAGAAPAEARPPPRGGNGAPRELREGGGGESAESAARPDGAALAPEQAAPPPAPRQGPPAARTGGPLEVKVPSMGDYRDVPIIDVLVKPGDQVKKDDSLVTLESDKATMDVPSPADGTVREVRVKVGDRVSEGGVLAVLDGAGAAAEQEAAPPSPAPAAEAPAPADLREGGAGAPAEGAAVARAAPARPALAREGAAPGAERPEEARGVPHASPSVRRLTRELGVDLSRVDGSGPRGRILKDDVQRHVKEVLSGSAAARGGTGVGLDLPPWPKVDFAKFGPVETKALTRIRKLSKGALARNWVMIPHVTQHDEADITELEAFRRQLNEEHAKDGAKVTLLAFVVKACVAALKRFPDFNSSLEGDHLVVKRYWHVGFAADTPSGLVVPVVKDADRKGVLEIARELAYLAAKARDGKLAPGDMQGGTFSISSLGG